jgi:hypothetical protein
MVNIELKEVEDGYQFRIDGHNKYQGERVRPNDRVIEMLELISEVVLGYKVKVERR